VSKRQAELELRRRLLIERSDWERQRLRADARVTANWMRLAQLIALAGRRAAAVYRYWEGRKR
jgi:hypothetical protein